MTSDKKALEAALNEANVQESSREGVKLKRLLGESAGRIVEDGKTVPFYRYAYAVADFLFSNPKQIVKTSGVVGATYADLVDTVTTLLRRQARIDAQSGATIPEVLSADLFLQQVLESSGKANAGLRTASLEAI